MIPKHSARSVNMKTKTTKKKVRQAKALARPTLSRTQALLSKPPLRRPLNAGTALGRYVHCALDPFNTNGSDGIPDGNKSMRIVVDHRFYTNITLNSGDGFELRLVPVPNAPLWIKPNAAITSAINVDSNSMNIGSQSLSGDYNWLVGACPPEYATYNQAAFVDGTGMAIPAETPHPYNAVRFRSVSLAMRLFYTGTAMSVSGTITSYRNKTSYIEGGVINQNTIVFWTASTGATTSASARTVFVSRLDSSQVSGILDKTSVTQRTEIPMQVRCVPTSNDREWQPIYPSKRIPLDTSTYRPSFVFMGSLGPSITPSGICGYDCQFENGYMKLTGQNPGSTYRVEVSYCVEYEPSAGTPFSQIAKPSPDAPALVYEEVNKAISDAPAVTNVGDSVHAAAAGVIQQAASGIVSNFTDASNAANRIRAQQADSRNRASAGRPSGRRR